MFVEMSIEGPRPMNVVTPIGSTITFTCDANLTELTDPFFSISWIVDGIRLPAHSGKVTKDDDLFKIATLQLDALQDYTTGVLIQCTVLATNFKTVFRSGNATLITFGNSSADLNHKYNKYM